MGRHRQGDHPRSRWPASSGATAEVRTARAIEITVQEQKTPLAVGAERATQIVKSANSRGQAMSLNFDMYQDGTVTPQTLEMFRKLKKEIYGKE
jgi:hypothetical protein